MSFYLVVGFVWLGFNKAGRGFPSVLSCQLDNSRMEKYILTVRNGIEWNGMEWNVYLGSKEAPNYKFPCSPFPS